jgi:hypothetical protein
MIILTPCGTRPALKSTLPHVLVCYNQVYQKTGPKVASETTIQSCFKAKKTSKPLISMLPPPLFPQIFLPARFARTPKPTISFSSPQIPLPQRSNPFKKPFPPFRKGNPPSRILLSKEEPPFGGPSFERRTPDGVPLSKGRRMSVMPFP